jgi:hypothetical protein
MLEITVGTRKRIVTWGLVGFAMPILWGIVSFALFNAKESMWTNIYWYAVYVTCPPWLLPETQISWLVTPILNGILYGGVVFLICAVRHKQAATH